VTFFQTEVENLILQEQELDESIRLVATGGCKIVNLYLSAT
jgi:hypothetical protein